MNYAQKYEHKKINAQGNMSTDHHNAANGYYDSIYNSIVHFNDEDVVGISDNQTLTQGSARGSKHQVSVCIVIPTYNEAHNIISLLDLVYAKEQQREYTKEDISMNVLVVDDNSPDGTADIVRAYQDTNLNVHILSRQEKNGLGMAYIAGMQHAIKTLNPDILFEMDGDLSHGPEYLLPMIAKIREGADFVIGSRYIKGGSIPDNWGAKRRLISKTANVFAKTILGIKDVNDCTGGFRAIRTSTLKQIDLSSLKTKGYAFQISLLDAMRKNDAVITEIPIAFKDRTHGQSKMRMYDIVEEGLFVVKTALKNQFSPRKAGLVRKQENWLATDAQEEKPIIVNSFEKSRVGPSTEDRMF